MTVVAILLFIMMPFGIAYRIYKRYQARKQEFALAVTVRTFIRENGLDECKPGFYGEKEKLLAKQLRVDDNAAYKLISIYQRPVKK